jgi:hypothetical protein
MNMSTANISREVLGEKNEDDIAIPPDFTDSTSSVDEKQAENLDEKPSDAQPAVSRPRSAISSHARFSHPLANAQSSPDTIVDFDGSSDPYLPMNWPFRKKALITICYGLVGDMLDATPRTDN